VPNLVNLVGTGHPDLNLVLMLYACVLGYIVKGSLLLYNYMYNRLPKAMPKVVIVKLNYFYDSEKRLRNGPFAENARGLSFVQVHHALEHSAPDSLPGVACGVLKPSAEQQGVQEQRQDDVLGGLICRKESRQPTHTAWSCASAACIIHQLHVESPGFHKMLPHRQGKVTTVQVGIQQPYVHCTKKVPEYRYPLYYGKFKIHAASCICDLH
jgi:hypothetical protein